MRTKRLGWLAVCLLLALPPARPEAETKPDLRAAMNSLLALREFREVAISPDGRRLAWVEQYSEIYVSDLGAPESAPRRLNAARPGAPPAGHDIAWSPDGSRLAFLSDAAEAGQFELYVTDLGGGAPDELTHLKGFLAEPKWSPDGKSIAVLFTENAPRAAGPLEPMTPDEGVVESHIYEQRLTLVDVATGRVRQLTPPDLYVYEYDWSPDGMQLVATAAHGNGDDNWYIAELEFVSVTSGETRSIYKPPLQIAAPRWSPDGKSIAFIAGLMSDEGNTGGDVFVIPAAGGDVKDLTPGLAASPSSIYWLPGSRALLTVEYLDGQSGLARVDLQSGKVDKLWSGPETLWRTPGAVLGVSLANDGKTSAVIRTSFEAPPEVWVGELGRWKQLTHANRGLERTWGKSQSLHWTSDGNQVQGWLLYPRDFEPSRRYPLVVLVHGGPGSASLPKWPGAFFNVSLLSTDGYFVLMPNPRGSFGMGEAFARANVKDFGGGDFRDILAGVDEAVKILPVDANRVGITGWSYGGFMTMWAVTQTHRFRAAVAGAGLANWQSYYGENDLDQWMIPFFGASMYDDPSVYAKSSPINFVKNVRTPTLVLVGDRDGECPAPQSYEFWHALKTLGVKTQFVIYPNEGHDIHDPAHRRDIAERMVAWFDEHLR